MKFILRNNDVLKNCANHLYGLPLDGKTEVVFQDANNKRSDNQRDLAHKWARYISEHVGQTIEEYKDDVRYAMGLYKVIEKDDRVYIKFKSTNDFTVKEMSDFMTSLQITAGELGIVLPAASYYGYEN